MLALFLLHSPSKQSCLAANPASVPGQFHRAHLVLQK